MSIGKIAVAAAAVVTMLTVAKAAEPMKLRNDFTGPDKCLDIVNDGVNNRLQMAACGNYSGQAWMRGPNSDDTLKLRTGFTGEDRCLDVVNNGANNKLQMAACGNYSGQMWTMTRSGAGDEGFFIFRNRFTGDNKCLDVVNDGVNNKLQMATCGNFTGQHWHVH